MNFEIFSVGFNTSVKGYKLIYYTYEYQPYDSDILAPFRVTPQPGVSPGESATVVAAESSTVLIITKDDATTSKQFLEKTINDLQILVAYIKTFQGPPYGILVKRDKLNKYGRPLLGCTIKPKLGLYAINYVQAVYKYLRSRLNFTKHYENANSKPFMFWRDHFLFCAEAVHNAQVEVGEMKGHYLHATIGIRNKMIKGIPIIMDDYIIGGFTVNASLPYYCQDNDPNFNI
ncbi:hypothetical protein Cgig2_012343 [Carnegiea gigantea]|uniref:Ribulose bisphosphate carboxylase large chain n=1 Tax=Carnegiea gigantea TaxID=171969 RepID=A0A9Q1JQL8_9CARY|nr:hypothetical protein Cgig2_012343 [Carnegiea gigantea]